MAFRMAVIIFVAFPLMNWIDKYYLLIGMGRLLGSVLSSFPVTFAMSVGDNNYHKRTGCRRETKDNYEQSPDYAVR